MAIAFLWCTSVRTQRGKLLGTADLKMFRKTTDSKCLSAAGDASRDGSAARSDHVDQPRAHDHSLPSKPGCSAVLISVRSLRNQSLKKPKDMETFLKMVN